MTDRVVVLQRHHVKKSEQLLSDNKWIIQNGGNKAVCDPGATFALKSLRAANFSHNPFDAIVQEILDTFTSVEGIKRRVFMRSRVRTKREISFGCFRIAD